MRSLLLFAALAAGACSHQGAVESAQRDVLRNPNESAAWVALGDAHRRAGEDDRAGTAYQQALRLDPDNEQLQRRAGNGARSESVMRLESQVLADPTNDELWGDLGDAYAEMGDRRTALRHYEHALSLDPDDGEWQRKTVEFAADGDVDALLERMRQSNDDEAIGDVADRLRAMGRESEACELYLRAMMLDPGDGEWQQSSATCPEREGLLDQIRAEALASGDDERIGDLGDMYQSRGDAAAACEMYQRANEIDPADSEWIGNLAECGGDYVPDLGSMRAQAIASGDDERIGDVGDLYRNAGDTEAACDLYRQALALDPGDSEWQQNIATCDGGSGFQPYEGVEPMPGGIGRAPLREGSDALIALGRSALAAGDRRTALQHFEAALLDSPLSGDARVGVMSITGKTLVTVLEEVSAQRPDNDELWGDLGDAYLESGRLNDAIRAFQRAEELDPDDYEWQGKLDVLVPERLGAE